MWRRWYVFVPLLAIAAATGVIVPKDSQPSYTIESIVLMQYPTQEVFTEPGSTVPVHRTLNPLLVNNGGLAPAASLLATVMSASSTAGTVSTTFPGSYSVVATDKQPLLTIDTTSGDKAAAKTANHTVFDLMVAQINKQQSATISDPTQKVTLGYVTQDELSVAKTSKYRAMAVLLVAGILVALTLTVLFDAAVSRRGRRRAPRGTRTATASEVGVHS
jgi:hypothetical protein